MTEIARIYQEKYIVLGGIVFPYFARGNKVLMSRLSSLGYLLDVNTRVLLTRPVCTSLVPR